MPIDTSRTFRRVALLSTLVLFVAVSPGLGQQWAPLGDGTDGVVRALAFDGFNLYVAGTFSTVDGDVAANNIAVYNILTGIWLPLGDGTTGDINAMAIHPVSGDVYVGGAFSAAGGSPANKLAYWTGVSWSTVGTPGDDGIGGTVQALAFDPTGNLYVGGLLGPPGDGSIPSPNNIAMWDGGAWSVLGVLNESGPDTFGVGGTVNAIVIGKTGNVFVGGTFVTAASGTIDACRVAMWDGNNWSALGAGVNATVLSLALDMNDSLYVGGQFSKAADDLEGGPCSLSSVGITTNNIAKWNGISWTPLINAFGANGVSGNVVALLADPVGDVVVGGLFLDAGGCPGPCEDADKIAIWQPLINEWLPIDKGFHDNSVNALAFAPSIALSKAAVDVSVLVAGGSFTLDGSESDTLLTVAQLQTELPVELVSFDAVVSGNDVELRWSTASETSNAGFEVQHEAPQSESPGWSTIDFVEGAGTTQDPKEYIYQATGLGSGTHRFRLKQIDYDGSFEFSSIVEVMIEIPGTHVLTDAYPNPFNPQASFSLTVGREQPVQVELFDVTGRLVQTLFDGSLSANVIHRFVLGGAALPGGVYVYRATGENFVESRKVVLIK